METTCPDCKTALTDIKPCQGCGYPFSVMDILTKIDNRRSDIVEVTSYSQFEGTEISVSFQTARKNIETNEWALFPIFDCDYFCDISTMDTIYRFYFLSREETKKWLSSPGNVEKWIYNSFSIRQKHLK